MHTDKRPRKERKKRNGDKFMVMIDIRMIWMVSHLRRRRRGWEGSAGCSVHFGPGHLVG